MSNTQFCLTIGLDAISSYKRLAYTPWHAIAEFVDNATQSYFDHRAELDAAYDAEGEPGLAVYITYDPHKQGGFLRISDNAMGMSSEELVNALHVALRPANTSGRSKYGMGLKTAACWIGNEWSVRTKRLGETREHTVEVNVTKVASGDSHLQSSTRDDLDPAQHYTIVEVWNHNRKFQGRTLGKIKQYLESMYREDFRNGDLDLYWQDTLLEWHEPHLLTANDGHVYKKDFAFQVDGRAVSGWVGILEHGSRADAGFSIIHSGRVVRGWPDSWRPSSLYGQIQGSNDLVNQRLVGEIHLDEFEVSHTKDDILWLGTQEEDVEEQLRTHCNDYREVALAYRKSRQDERGPSSLEVEVAIDEVRRELLSPEMLDRVKFDIVPPEEVVQQGKQRIIGSVESNKQETFLANLNGLQVKVFVEPDLSPNDPYVLSESTRDSEIIVIVNCSHPHWNELKASEGVANYLRHCVYDAISEWKARTMAARIDPDTIKLIKDQLLRVSLLLEGHTILDGSDTTSLGADDQMPKDSRPD